MKPVVAAVVLVLALSAIHPVGVSPAWAQVQPGTGQPPSAAQPGQVLTREDAERLGIDLSNPQQAFRRARQLGFSEAQIQTLLRSQPARQNQPAGSIAPTMTAEEARREARELGIDLTDPDQARRRAREVGLSESHIEQMLAATGTSVSGSGFGGSTGSLRSAASALAGLPEINPSQLTLEDKPELVSVMVRFRTGQAGAVPFGGGQPAAGQSGASGNLNGQSGASGTGTYPPGGTGGTGGTDRNQGVPAGGNPIGAALTGGMQGYGNQGSSPSQGYDPAQNYGATQGYGSSGQAPSGSISTDTSEGSEISQLEVYLLSPTRTDTLRDQRAQVISNFGGEQVWMATILVPPTTAPGVWTLAVETFGTGGKSLIDPAGLLRIESQNAQELEYFGYKLFQNASPTVTFAPSAPVSDGYIVGAEDELRLMVWGAAEFQYDLSVDGEGRVYVPSVGQFTVAGRRIEDLREDMRLWLSQNYAGLVGDPPTVYMDLMVTRMRPMQVMVMGEVPQPGGYSVPSGSSVLNALYTVGGPLTRGSLRNIQVIRGSEVADVDLYDYLLRGYDPTPVLLRAGDHIFVPGRGKTVSIQGAVKRAGIFELKDGEMLQDLLGFAGGLAPEAYTNRFQIERIIPFEKRADPTLARVVTDYSLADVLAGRERVTLEDGDKVTIFSIPDESSLAAQSRIPAAQVTGAVFKPGRYELGGSIRTVRDLIESADGFTGDVYMDRAQLIRLSSDLEREIVSLDLSKVMEDSPMHNLVLRPQDSLRVFSKQELREERNVMIYGRVRKPGTYPYADGMTVEQLLFQAGGLNDPEFLKDVHLERADIYRESPDGRSDKIIPFDLSAALQGEGLAGEQLMPGDEIRIYPASVEVVEERFVTVSGGVKTPGEYSYRDGMTIEDLILQAGGFAEDAYTESVEVARASVDDVDNGRQATILQVPIDPSFKLASASTDMLTLASADTAPLASEFELQHRDRVYVRINPDYKLKPSVYVNGEVRFPGEYTLVRENERLSDVLRRAGGPTATGYVQGGKLIRDGEQVIVEMKRALTGDTRADVVLLPGDSLIIPLRPNTVAVRGNVANEGLIKYEPGRRVSYYLERAGGLQEHTEAVLLRQASGATYKLDRRLFGILPRENPVVQDGATIMITPEPYQLQAQRFDWAGTVTQVLAIATSTISVILLARSLEK